MQTLKRRHKHQAVTNTETQARMPTQKTVQTESEKYTRQDNTISFVVFFFCVLSYFCCSSSASRVSSTTVCRVFLLILLLLLRFLFLWSYSRTSAPASSSLVKCFSAYVLFMCCLRFSFLVFFSFFAFLFFAGPLLRISFLLLCGCGSLSASVSVVLGLYYSASLFVLT